VNESPTIHQNRPVWQNPRVVGAAIGALVFVIFALQNSGSVDVDFLFWGFDLRLIVLMIVCAVIGAAIWELAKYLWRRNRRQPAPDDVT
jgi:uncharacterized integral membrane protein